MGKIGNLGNRTHRRGHRKCLFREEMISEGYKLGALGLEMCEIADFWRVGERSLYRWAKSRPAFAAQIAKGRAEADLTVIQSVLEQARQGNMTAAIFWLKNRCGWRDAYDLKHQGMKDTKVLVQVYNNAKDIPGDTQRPSGEGNRIEREAKSLLGEQG